MIRYTAKHSTGLVKTRTSKDHTAPRYTHAVWVDFGTGDARSNRTGWQCRVIASESTANYEAGRYVKAGYPIELVTVEAT